MAVQIGTLRPTVARPSLHQPAWLGLAGIVTALLFTAMSLVGRVRGVQDGLPAAAVGRAVDGCVIETTYVLAETNYTLVPVLVCWDRDANLQVPSPERAH